MALDYSESQIVGRVLEDDDSVSLSNHCLLKNWLNFHEFDFTRESVLPSGKRMDAFWVSDRKRFAWIVEFKVHAKPDALAQILRYEREVRNQIIRRHKIPGSESSRMIFGIQKTLLAQSFDSDTLFLASRLRIQAIQFNPITPDFFELRHLTKPFKSSGAFNRVFETVSSVEYL